MTYGIVLIVAGLLANPKLLMGKNPKAEEMLKKIAVYQGWIGLVLFVWGVWGIIQSVLTLGLLSTTPVWWATLAAVAVLNAILGLLLGFNLINKYILSKNAQSAEKGKEMHAKLMKKQSLFGTLGILVGIWALVAFYVL